MRTEIRLVRAPTRDERPVDPALAMPVMPTRATGANAIDCGVATSRKSPSVTDVTASATSTVAPMGVATAAAAYSARQQNPEVLRHGRSRLSCRIVVPIERRVHHGHRREHEHPRQEIASKERYRRMRHVTSDHSARINRSYPPRTSASPRTCAARMKATTPPAGKDALSNSIVARPRHGNH
jgi:hypothetical protein